MEKYQVLFQQIIYKITEGNKMKKLAVANGQYQNSVGETKTRWVNVGVMGVSSNGKEFMLIDPKINFNISIGNSFNILN